MALKSKKETVSTFDKLSRQRTLLANERTMLAHIRTAVALIAFGIGAVELLEKYFWSGWVGTLSIIFGIILLVFGLVYYPIRNNQIKKY